MTGRERVRKNKRPRTHAHATMSMLMLASAVAGSNSWGCGLTGVCYASCFRCEAFTEQFSASNFRRMLAGHVVQPEEAGCFCYTERECKSHKDCSQDEHAECTSPCFDAMSFTVTVGQKMVESFMNPPPPPDPKPPPVYQKGMKRTAVAKGQPEDAGPLGVLLTTLFWIFVIYKCCS